MSPVNPSLLDRDLELIRKRYGADIMHIASAQIPIDRIPLSSPTLMRITAGGIPIGHVTRLYGDPSTGKSRIAIDIIAAAQAMRTERFPNGMVCCYWNVESMFDPIYAAQRGVDTDLLQLQHTKIIEDIAGQLELLLASVHLHVIDSASFAMPLEELVGKENSKNPEYQVQVGAHARAWKRAINRIHTRMDKDENVLIIIDHIGGISPSGHGGRKPLSGRRMEFRSDLSLHLERGQWLYYNKNGRLEVKDKIKEETGESPEGRKTADGTAVSVLVAKSRVCRPLLTGNMRFDLNRLEFDDIFELIDFGIYYDKDGELAHRSKNASIIQKAGAWYKPPGYEKAFQGMDALYACVSEDTFLQDTIKRAMLSKSA